MCEITWIELLRRVDVVVMVEIFLVYHAVLEERSLHRRSWYMHRTRLHSDLENSSASFHVLEQEVHIYNGIIKIPQLQTSTVCSECLTE